MRETEERRRRWRHKHLVRGEHTHVEVIVLVHASVFHNDGVTTGRGWEEVVRGVRLLPALLHVLRAHMLQQVGRAAGAWEAVIADELTELELIRPTTGGQVIQAVVSLGIVKAGAGARKHANHGEVVEIRHDGELHTRQRGVWDGYVESATEVACAQAAHLITLHWQSGHLGATKGVDDDLLSRLGQVGGHIDVVFRPAEDHLVELQHRLPAALREVGVFPGCAGRVAAPGGTAARVVKVPKKGDAQVQLRVTQQLLAMGAAG
mmetsp:Transcript_3058/g.5562  ORF Transcript_3058/g.5562 Transcript_3058/m.5562 type:complete len:263 (+) Transcript_3058:352-1140(+)